MKLFIAEKPSLARAIADGLGVVRREKTHIECRGGCVVTWCFGHLLELAEPDEYVSGEPGRKGKKPWRMQDLPIFPQAWLSHPRRGATAQLKAVGSLIRKADALVNAGDPDREGQLLVDEVLEHFSWNGPTERFWSSAIDPVSIRKALAHLRPNGDFAGMRDAARGRSRADWLVGMNITRAYTLRAQLQGARELVVVGRVQTPTLTLVAHRDWVIRNFVPVDYTAFAADCSARGVAFSARWLPSEGQAGMDEDGKLLVSREAADALAERFKDVHEARVASFERRIKRQAQPRCFSLADMQQEASRLFGFSAERTLETLQSLYEKHKCCSYPRTDCQYLPESQKADAPRVLKAIAATLPAAAKACAAADLTIESPTWNDAKVTAHHGIIPTGQPASWSSLSPDEQKLYAEIARRYLAQFFGPCVWEASKAVLDIAGETFAATGKVPQQEGWKILYRRKDREEQPARRKTAAGEDPKGKDEESDQILPELAPGESVAVSKIRRSEGKTKPPAHFTEGTLIAAMENIHRAFEDEKVRSQLKEAGGIGTPATRAAIIELLKKRKFLEKKGKSILSTEAGRSLLRKVSPKLRSAAMTARFEEALSQVEAGRLGLEAFEASVKAFVAGEVQAARESTGRPATAEATSKAESLPARAPSRPS